MIKNKSLNNSNINEFEKLKAVEKHIGIKNISNSYKFSLFNKNSNVLSSTQNDLNINGQDNEEELNENEIINKIDENEINLINGNNKMMNTNGKSNSSYNSFNKNENHLNKMIQMVLVNQLMNKQLEII